MTKIEWCDQTINPVVGCSKCSPGCDNCYAERFAARLAKNPLTTGKYAPVVDENGKWNGNINLSYSFLSSSKTRFPRPISKPKLRKKIFVGSMCDLFNLDAYSRFDEYMNKKYGKKDKYHSAIYVLGNLWNYFANNSQHTFFLLTKRPEGIVKAFNTILRFWPQRTGAPWPLPNVWLGVTVCTQEEADQKLPILMQIPASKRFVSVEPMLERIDLTRYLELEERYYSGDTISGCLDYSPVFNWVICGGETGANARPLHPDWVRSLRDQSLEAETPFFFKSWGEWCSYDQAPNYLDSDLFLNNLPIRYLDTKKEKVFKIGKKHSGHLIDDVEWRQFPKEEAASEISC